MEVQSAVLSTGRNMQVKHISKFIKKNQIVVERVVGKLRVRVDYDDRWKRGINGQSAN